MPVLNDADDVKLGAQQVDAVYAGTELVWTNALPTVKPVLKPTVNYYGSLFTQSAGCQSPTEIGDLVITMFHIGTATHPVTPPVIGGSGVSVLEFYGDVYSAVSQNGGGGMALISTVATSTTTNVTISNFEGGSATYYATGAQWVIQVGTYDPDNPILALNTVPGSGTTQVFTNLNYTSPSADEFLPLYFNYHLNGYMNIPWYADRKYKEWETTKSHDVASDPTAGAGDQTLLNKIGQPYASGAHRLFAMLVRGAGGKPSKNIELTGTLSVAGTLSSQVTVHQISTPAYSAGDLVLMQLNWSAYISGAPWTGVGADGEPVNSLFFRSAIGGAGYGVYWYIAEGSRPQGANATLTTTVATKLGTQCRIFTNVDPVNPLGEPDEETSTLSTDLNWRVNTTDTMSYWVGSATTAQGGGSMSQLAKRNPADWNFVIDGASEFAALSVSKYPVMDGSRVAPSPELFTALATRSYRSFFVRGKGIPPIIGNYFNGGEIVEDGGYRYHTFKTSGTLEFVNNDGLGTAVPIEYLIVAGGGAGGGANTVYQNEYAGGGGAGGAVVGSTQLAADQTVTIGAGGAPVSGGAGGDGSATYLGLIATQGGGGGGFPYSSPAKAGGSGGGGGSTYQVGSTSPGTGTEDQGYSGGSGDGQFNAGGGGGAGGVGKDGGAGTGLTSTGGPGIEWPAGSGKWVAGGGGGAHGQDGTAFNPPHGGGNGSYGASTQAEAGTPNTGGGGGGGCRGTGGVVLGAAGGSGVVMVRYPVQRGN